MAIDMNYFGSSHVGKVRTENQDCYGIFIRPDEFSLFVVCDGMGGAKGGKIASKLAIETIKLNLDLILKADSHQSLIGIVNDLFQASNQTVFNKSNEDPKLAGMGTTMLVLIFTKYGSLVAHVGDSRLYKISNKKIEILTKDHTFAQELVDAGAMNISRVHKSPVSHLLTRAVGIQKKIEVEILDITKINQDDLYILVSDGLHNHVNQDRILDIYNSFSFSIVHESKEVSFKNFNQLLISEAINQGGSDNITVLSVSPGEAKGLASKLNEEFIEKDFIFDDQLETLGIMPQIDYGNDIVGSYTKSKSKNFISLFGLLSGGLFLIFILNNLFFSTTTNLTLNSDIVSSSEKKSELIKLLSTKSSKVNTSGIFGQFLALEDIIGDKEQLSNLVSRKTNEILYVSTSPSVRTDEYEDFVIPDQPIDWDKEEQIFKTLKNNSTNNFLGIDEKFEIINSKSEIRERIFDIDQKLKALVLGSPQEIEKIKQNLKQHSEEILSEIKLLDKAREIALVTRTNFIKKFREVSGDDLLRLASLYTSISPELENLRKKIIELNRLSDFYKKLLSQSSAQIGVASILSSVSRDRSLLEEELKIKINTLSTVSSEEITKYILNIDWLKLLLQIEDQRNNRSLSFFGAYNSLTKERKIGVLKALLEKREELLSKYLSYEKQISLDQEFEFKINNLK